MAHPLLESGDGAPSLRPLYMLLPYLWPKGRPDLRLRVVVSLVCLAFAILATVANPYVLGLVTDQFHSLTGTAIAVAFGLTPKQTTPTADHAAAS